MASWAFGLMEFVTHPLLWCIPGTSNASPSLQAQWCFGCRSLQLLGPQTIHRTVNSMLDACTLSPTLC